jgi:hypothetical protein
VTPSPEPAPTPEPALDVQIGLLKAGKGLTLKLTLNEGIASPCDFYFLADTPAGAYTLYLDGKVEKGIMPIYKRVKRLPEDYVATVRPVVNIPASMKGSTVTFYAAFIEAGNIPPVSKLSDLTPDTPYVILMNEVSMMID